MKHALLLLAALAVSAPAQEFTMPEGLGSIMMSTRRLATDSAQAFQAFRASTYFWTAQALAPLNAGFQGLGPAGKTGKISGPPFGGDGTYRVIQNDPMQMVFDMRTGYVVGRFTLSRDASGRDTLGFTGSTKDGVFGGWSKASGTYPGRITYGSSTDSGSISWQLNGKQINDTYRGGRAGSRSMTISLKGHDHTFKQD